MKPFILLSSVRSNGNHRKSLVRFCNVYSTYKGIAVERIPFDKLFWENELLIMIMMIMIVFQD